MKEKKSRKVVQTPIMPDEFMVVKSVVYMKKYDSIAAYVRALLEKDVLEYKKTIKDPSVLSSLTVEDWELLSKEELAEFMNKLGDVRPRTPEAWLAMRERVQIRATPYPFGED